MSDAESSQKPYLGSEKTSGHEPINHHDTSLLNDLSISLDREEITVIGSDILDADSLSGAERKLINHTGFLGFLGDETERVRLPLEGEKLHQYITLLKKISLSSEELQIILDKKMDLKMVIHLRGLRSFETRVEANKAEEELSINNEGRWDWSSGDYGKNGGYATHVVNPEEPEHLWDAVRKIPENLEQDSLLGEELTIADTIQQQLDAHSGSQPFIFLDVGGLAGLSWYKLALHFEDYVKSGKAVFVVTSLGADFNQAMELVTQHRREPNPGEVPYNFSPYRAGIYADDMDLIEKNRDLVHHIKTDVPGLMNRVIGVGGENISLMGNVALINDNHAVAMHSLIPSLHLPMLASLLNEQGVYKSVDTTNIFAPKPGENPYSRDAELQRAFRILEHEQGMEPVREAEAGSTPELKGVSFNHIFFRKPNGPKIRAFLLPKQLDVAIGEEVLS
jgi:hypothetical protein